MADLDLSNHGYNGRLLLIPPAHGRAHAPTAALEASRFIGKSPSAVLLKLRFSFVHAHDSSPSFRPNSSHKVWVCQDAQRRIQRIQQTLQGLGGNSRTAL